MSGGEALLFAAIGPNPASVIEAVWALRRQRGVRIVEAHLVSLARGQHWLEAEVLGARGALAELREVLPDVLPGGDDAVRATLTVTADGAPVVDDAHEDDAAAYRRAMWTSARACLERAGARPVVFLLAGGRQRTMTAYAVAVFQLLARAGDELVDVRVSDRRAEGGSGFFFPEQRQAHLVTDGGVVDVRTVEVKLVPVAVPRLGGLVRAEHLGSFEDALATSRTAIEAMTPPRLMVDLANGQVRVNEELLTLTPGQLVWYGLLAARRRADEDDDGAVPVDAAALMATVLGPVARAPWAGKIRDFTVRAALGLPMIHGKDLHDDEDKAGAPLSKLRADTRAAVRRWVRQRVRPAWERWLVPAPFKRDGQAWQRLPLEPQHIELRWPA